MNILYLLQIHACSNLSPLTKNATIFWEHEVFVDCCHSNTVIYIFSVLKKKSKKNRKKPQYSLIF